MLNPSKLSPAEPAIASSLRGKTADERIEIPGSAEYLAARLAGRELACPHFPKYRVGDARHPQRYPSRLGFFHASSVETRISFLDTSKLCTPCLGAVVPDGFNCWSTSATLSNNPDWASSSSEGSYPLLFQAGTEGFHHSQPRPGSASVPKHLGTSPMAISLPCVDGAKEAWQWLEAQRKPFYMDQLHLAKGWSPLAEMAARADGIVSQAAGTSFVAAPTEPVKKKKDPGTISAAKTSRGKALKSKPRTKAEDVMDRKREPKTEVKADDDKAAQPLQPIAGTAATSTAPHQGRNKDVKPAGKATTNVAKKAAPRPASSQSTTCKKNWHRQAPIPLDSSITAPTYSDYLRSAGPLGQPTACLPLERLPGRSCLISDTKDLLDLTASSGPSDLLRLLEPTGKRASPAPIASSGFAKSLIDQAPAKSSLLGTKAANVGSAKTAKELGTKKLSPPPKEKEVPKRTKKPRQDAQSQQHPSQPAGPRCSAADKKPQNKPTQTQGQSPISKLKSTPLLPPPPKGHFESKKSVTGTPRWGKDNVHTSPKLGTPRRGKDKVHTSSKLGTPRPKNERGKGGRGDAFKTGPRPIKANTTFRPEGETLYTSHTNTGTRHTETRTISAHAPPAIGLGPAAAGFVTLTETRVATAQAAVPSEEGEEGDLEYDDNILGPDGEDVDIIELESHSDGDMSSWSLSDADFGGGQSEDDEDGEIQQDDDGEANRDDDQDVEESEVEIETDQGSDEEVDEGDVDASEAEENEVEVSEAEESEVGESEVEVDQDDDQEVDESDVDTSEVEDNEEAEESDVEVSELEESDAEVSEVEESEAEESEVDIDQDDDEEVDESDVNTSDVEENEEAEESDVEVSELEESDAEVSEVEESDAEESEAEVSEVEESEAEQSEVEQSEVDSDHDSD